MLALFTWPVLAQAWTAELQPAPGGSRAASDPIQLELHAVPDDVFDRLYVLLDSVDVTEFAAVEGNVVTISLSVPISGGVHQLSLVELQDNGDIVVMGSWTLEVRQSARLEAWGLRVNVTQNLWTRIDESDTPMLPERVTADGAANLEGMLQNDGIQLTGRAQFLWDSLEENLDDDNGSVGDWLIEGSGGPATLRVGHHELPHSTLALDRFNRRGLSLEFNAEKLRTSLAGFSFRGTPLVGFHEGFGVHDDSNRVSGIELNSRPLEEEWGRLDVTGVWLTGKSPDNGSLLSGTVGDDSVMDGSSWAFQGYTSLFGDRIQAAGGFSRSRSDFAGGGSSRTGDAQSFQLTVDPFPELVVYERPLLWTTTFDDSKIGDNYASLGNAGLLPDRRTRAIRSALYWAGFDLTFYAGRIEDDVNNRAAVPRARAETWSIETSFTPAELLDGERPGALAWLGMPTLWGSFRRDKLEPRHVPSSFPSRDLLADTLTDSGSVLLDFQHDRWSWGVGYTIIDVDDKTTARASSVLQQTEIRADATLGEVTLGGRFQLDQTQLTGAPDPTNYLLSFFVSTPIYRDRVYFTGDVSVNRSEATGNSVDQVSIASNLSIDWTAIEAAELRPGLMLSFLGRYQGFDDDVNSGVDQDAYQLYLRATLSWSSLWGAL